MEQYAAYLRKSRFDRDYAELTVEETLKRQEGVLTKLAQERHLFIAKTYHEVVSGESIAARPEIQKLLEEVNEGIYAGVLVVEVERLARGNSADQAYISQVFQFSGTKIITPFKTYDPSNEFDEEYFEFGLFMSRREYKTIVRRLVRGRESSATEGKFVGSIAPYGYERVKIPHEKGWTLVPHPVEADNVRLIFRLWLQQLGTVAICNELNDRGIATRHGDRWNYSTIAAIVNNPVYIGKIKRGYCKITKVMEDGLVKHRCQHEKDMTQLRLYNGLHEPLISESDFMMAQEIIKQRKPNAKVKPSSGLSNPFAGLIFCACCGKRIERTTMAASQNHAVRFRCISKKYCENKSADFDVVEREIISALRQWLEGYRIKLDTVGFAEDVADLNKRLKQAQQIEKKAKAQLDNAYDLLEQGVYTLEIFRGRQAKLTAAVDDAAQERERLENAIRDLENNTAAQHNIVPQTEQLLASYDDMTVAERNKLLKAILYKVLYKRGKDGMIEIDLYPRIPQIKAIES